MTAFSPRVTVASLQVQINRARANGWLELFARAEKRYGLPKGLLLAVASRETSMSQIIGDGGHGRGIFQFDDRYQQAFLREYKALQAGGMPPVKVAAMYAARILAAHHARALKDGIPAARAWKFAASAYNRGYTGARNGYYQHGDSDYFTAGRDYAADVMWRRKQFAMLLKLAPIVAEARQAPAAIPPVELDARSLVSSHGYQTPARIVLHSTESYDSRGTGDLYGIGAFWGRQGLGYGCQLGIDEEGLTARYVDDTEIGWCTASYNTGSLNIEQVGFARFTRAQWLARPRQLAKVARWLAYWSERYNIPLVRNPVRGVLTHADATAYKRISGGHWDPGPGYPIDYVLRLAIQYRDRGTGAPSLPVLTRAARVAQLGKSREPGRWQCVRAGKVLAQGPYAQTKKFCSDKRSYWARRGGR